MPANLMPSLQYNGDASRMRPGWDEKQHRAFSGRDFARIISDL
jgi:hypothetical protein